MTLPIDAIMAERAESERRLKLARDDLLSVEATLRRAGLKAFLAAISERGIIEGARIVIEGSYSAAWGAKHPDIRHGADPVAFLGASVDSLPATRPHPNSTDQWWWFRVTIARLKKDGTPRKEYRQFILSGDTPEAAAAKILTQ